MNGYLMRVSGLLGFGAWFALELYRQLIQDPILFGGQGIPPEFVVTAQQSLLVGSIVVIVYGQILAQGSAAKSPGSLRSLAIGVQWGVPVLFALDAIIDGFTSLGFFALVALLAAVIVPIGIVSIDRPK